MYKKLVFSYLGGALSSALFIGVVTHPLTISKQEHVLIAQHLCKNNEGFKTIEKKVNNQFVITCNNSAVFTTTITLVDDDKSKSNHPTTPY